MVAMICFSGDEVLTSRSVSGSCISASIVGSGLFRTLLKILCGSFLLLFSMVSGLPCLSIISMLVAQRYLQWTSLVILYNYPCWFFTWLFLSIYSC